MPHTTSAKKRLRQTAKRRLHNRAVLRAVKLQVKQVETVADEGSLDELKKQYNLAAKQAKKGTFMLL